MILLQSAMEQSADPPHSTSSPAGIQPPVAGNQNQPGTHPPVPVIEPPAAGIEAPEAGCGVQGKRLKELENAALQTSLNARMEERQPGEDTEPQTGDGAPSPGLPLHQHLVPAEEEEEEREAGRKEEQRTLTDHLNKRLLSSFLEKLNQADLALPGVQRLDCAVAEEDSNRATEDW